MALVFDRLAVFTRGSVIGRDAMGEAVLTPVEVARGWCSLGDLEAGEAASAGLAAVVETVAVTLRAEGRVPDVAVGDRVALGGASYLVRAVLSPALDRRGLRRLALAREVVDA